MTWWGWVIGGAILLGVELFFVSVDFYLVFIGSAAIVIGLTTGWIYPLAVWAQWASFAVLAIVLMVSFRSRVYRHLHGRSPVVHAGPGDGVMTVPVSLAPGESCRAEHGGTFWTVCNASDTPIPSGARARISSVEGLTLLVRPNT